MTRTSILAIASCLIACPIIAQAKRITVSGYVSEQKSGERLIGATVFVPEKNIGTSSNNFGFYSLTLEADSLELRASYAGFTTQIISLYPQKDTVVNISMEEMKSLDEVVVTANKDELHTRTQMSAIDMPIETIKSLPAFLGETDILKAIQLLPGIQGGTEGTSGIYVRGGGPGENLILLDGVPVYNASHLFGFFSVFNADAVKSVSVIKGGFPAHYGGRLSSVIDVNMKEGDQNGIHGEGGIGVASRLTLEGPIQKGKSSFMISGRRTFIDLLSKPFMKGEEKFGYYFYDLNGKVNFTLGKKDHVYISGYMGADDFGFEYKYRSYDYATKEENEMSWGNLTTVARWNHEFSPRLFGNLTAYYSKYQFNIVSDAEYTYSQFTENYLMKYSSGINDKAVKYDFDFLPSPNHYIKLGVGAVQHEYKPGVQRSRYNDGSGMIDTTTGSFDVTALEADAYIEDDIRITSRLKANIGLHWTGFKTGDKFFNSIQPRISARYLITDKLSAKASYAQMNQYIHLLTNSSIGLPTDLWLPATEQVPDELSRQLAGGFAYTLPKSMELTLEGYYKTMSNVIEYKEGSSFFNSTTNWEEKVEQGSAECYGAELFLQKKKGRLTGVASYTLSWAYRQFDNLNDGERFSYKYDRRHSIKLAAVYHLSKRIELGADWIYNTGNAITIPIGSYMNNGGGGEVVLYGSRNGYRMPAYHRGDLSVKFLKQKKHGERAWVVSIYNVYNRRNPFFIYKDYDSYKQVSLFSIVPFISYQFKL